MTLWANRQLKSVLNEVRKNESDTRRFELAGYWTNLIASMEKMQDKIIDLGIDESVSGRSARVIDQINCTANQQYEAVMAAIYESARVIFPEYFRD